MSEVKKFFLGSVDLPCSTEMYRLHLDPQTAKFWEFRRKYRNDAYREPDDTELFESGYGRHTVDGVPLYRIHLRRGI